MSNKSIPELSPNISPQMTDLVYVSKRKSQGGYVDRKAELYVVKVFVNTSRTVIKNGSYSVAETECDDRWFSNRDTGVAINFSLPPAVRGVKVGFIVEEGYAVTITPQANDKIVPNGGTDGRAIRATVPGSSIFIRGYLDGWHVVSAIGSWVAV